MKKISIKACRYCGGTEFVNAPQTNTAITREIGGLSMPVYIYHTICLDCGSMLRSFVYRPERLLTSRRRKQREQTKEE